MHVCHSQLYQMVDTCWLIAGIHRPMFSQCKVFALIFYSRSRVDREVTMMHFIDNHISRRFQRRTSVILPPLRIGSLPVDDSCTLSVHSYSVSINPRRVALPFIVDFYIESIVLAEQILIYGCSPGSILTEFHLYCFVSMSAFSGIIKHQAHLFCCW